MQNEELSNFFLDFDGEVFGASEPLMGDFTEEPGIPGDQAAITFGVIATDLPRLRELIGRTASILTADGRELARVRLDKVDAALSLVLGCVGGEATRLQGMIPDQYTSAPFP